MWLRVNICVLVAVAAGLLVLPGAAAGYVAERDQLSECAAGEWQPGLESPFWGREAGAAVEVEDGAGAPIGFQLTPDEAKMAADAAPLEALAGGWDGEAVVATLGSCRWLVTYSRDGENKALVQVDDGTGAVIEAWEDHQVGAELARGYDDAVAQKVNAWWIWLPLSLLFLLPFVNFRRLLRMVHLDLLAVLALGVSLFFLNRGEILTSVPLVYPVLAYLAGRGLWLGFRRRTESGPLLPHVPWRWLAVGAGVLVVARIALNLVDARVIDIGLASVIGADRILDGLPLYEGGFSPGFDLRGDVYGPANYLAYLPFVGVFGWDGTWDFLPAARAAAITFDLLTAVGLFFVGRRLRTGEEGLALGTALTFAWLACPFTLYAMNAGANDALVSMLTVAALLTITSRPAGDATRGAIVAFGSLAKFGIAALAPLLAAGTGERRTRSIIWFTGAFLVVAAFLLVPFLPDRGISEFWDRTFGYQSQRGSPLSIWGLAPSLDPLRLPFQALVVLFAAALAFFPQRRDLVQIAALGLVVTVGVEAAGMHWFYFYVLWFLPLLLVASFGSQAQALPASLVPDQAAEGEPTSPRADP